MSEQYPTMTADTLAPAVHPTFYFVGVSTASSSIRRVFPAWAEHLGLGEVDFVGIDMPLHAPAEDYRRVVEFFAADELSLGALVTTHKIDLFQAAADLFDEIDPLARMLDEVSSISKRGSALRAHAKDPITAGYAVDAIVPPGSWGGDRSLFVMGAGGSSVALSWHLTRPERGGDVPAEIIVSDRSADRLDALERLYEQFGGPVPLRRVGITDGDGPAGGNDGVLSSLPAGSVVVNATGLGKDAPGSPLAGTGTFPEHGRVWDLNYRGELVFLDQARAQERERSLSVHDGWVYFIHGWTRVIAEVFDVEIPTEGPGFDELSRIARDVRS